MSRRDFLRLALAVLLGAAIAFPLGLMVAGGGAEPASRAVSPEAAAAREMFSPRVLSDPYFLDQQRRGVEALEAHCRRTGAMCPEAREARRMLGELGNAG